MDILQCNPELFNTNPEELRQQLQENVKKIPFLNHYDLSQLKDLSIVRFRGMIQDMLDPEIYLEKYEVQTGDTGSRLQVGKFRDTLVLSPGEQVLHDSSANVHGERRPMFVVTVPGVNQWVNDHEKSSMSEVLLKTVQVIQQSNKRSLEDEEAMDTGDGINEPQSKKLEVPQRASVEPTNSLLSPEYLLNSPIPDRPSKACLVKIYDDFDSFALNTVIDVIGFLSVDPVLSGALAEEDEFIDETERQANHPPPSLIPRLHAVIVKKLDHINPLYENVPLSLQGQNVNAVELYKDLKLVLSQCLFEDTVAADYLLAHLISTVHTRNDAQALGQMSINLSNIPTEVLPDYTTQLYQVIEQLLPASHYFPMTLDNMNTNQFVPKKDYKTNKLTSGLLQLAPHTHLVLDETRLQAGKLEAAGVEAVKNLAQLINQQRLKYNFQYYEIEFDTDVPVMILSEGRTMLPVDSHIPIVPSSDSIPLMKETFEAVKHFLQPRLNALRMYLTQQRVAEFTVAAFVTDMIQNDFVQMRKHNEEVSAQDLHALLVLSRLLGLSQGSNTMSKEIWEQAKQLEMERKTRIERFSKRKNEP